MTRTSSLRRLRPAMLALPLLALQLAAKDYYLFTSFRGNGEDGVHLAISDDGRHWAALGNDRPWVKPEFAGMLMRDPWLGQGPDGVWHMLWTSGWSRPDGGGDLTIGHTTSRDLVTWSPQTRIPVMQDQKGVRNAWAPEAAWDGQRQCWVIFWASTIPGRFAKSERTGDSGYNHRIYAMTTTDWTTFSTQELWFNPGFNCIDATIAPVGRKWVMVFKDERKIPLKKQLRLAWADSPAGPWRRVSKPFTGQWVEGPTTLKIGDSWWIYFDHYTDPKYYGAMLTRDWRHFQHETAAVQFPVGQRHGTAVRITEQAAKFLESRQ